uniref:SH2 domain-containing protein n=1 Tax=Ditylenchus dipsaci TaxID=166011 RepID=A0A915CLZ2_9BILA
MYFHGKVSVAQVNSLLKVDGDFLIQMVDQASNFKTKELIGGGSLPVLSVKQSGKVRHWLIKQDKHKFGIEQAIFPYVSSMISFYLESQRSIVEGETVLIKHAVPHKSVGIEKCGEKAFSELPSIDDQNNVSSADVIALDEVSTDSAGIPCDLATSQVAALDGSSSGLAVDTSSSLDITASVFRCLGMGISEGDLGSASTVTQYETLNSAEEVPKCKSAPVQTPVPSSYSRGVKPSSDSLSSFSSRIRALLGLRFNCSNRVLHVAQVVTLDCFGPGGNARSVSFALPEVKSSCGTLGSPTARSAEHRCSACSPSLNFDYDSVDKLELRHNIAKAPSFFQFVRLQGATNGNSAPSMSNMIRLAELLFKDYKQHVVDSLQLGASA